MKLKLCYDHLVNFSNVMFRALCNGEYQGEDTQLGRDALQARNISTLLSSCKARVEVACNYSLGDMTKINVRLKNNSGHCEDNFYRPVGRNMSGN